MKHKNLWLVTMLLGSLLLIATFPAHAADIIITDPMNDVGSIDAFTEETTVVTSHPDIDVANLDIIRATYSQQGKQANVSLEVKGNIEDRGKLFDDDDFFDLQSYNAVDYRFELITSEEDYMISYSNRTAQLMYGNEQINLTSSDFSVVGGTLTISFSLVSEEEVYEELIVTTTFLKVDFENIDEEGFVYLQDIAPNPPLEIIGIFAPNIGSVGETIQFNGTVFPLTGQPPYQYRWDFGDEVTSTQLNPTHVYSSPGVYTYTFTVTDQAESSTSETGQITISAEGGSNGALPENMILFLAVLAIIIVVGVLVIVWIIRR
jgi:hypothetical protein